VLLGFVDSNSRAKAREVLVVSLEAKEMSYLIEFEAERTDGGAKAKAWMD
jgi:hypothetical protein